RHATGEGLQHPALVLMDIHLPGISGEEAFRQLRADPVTCAIPVIAVTASVIAQNQKRVMAGSRFSDLALLEVRYGRRSSDLFPEIQSVSRWRTRTRGLGSFHQRGPGSYPDALEKAEDHDEKRVGN